MSKNTHIASPRSHSVKTYMLTINSSSSPYTLAPSPRLSLTSAKSQVRSRSSFRGYSPLWLSRPYCIRLRRTSTAAGRFVPVRRPSSTTGGVLLFCAQHWCWLSLRISPLRDMSGIGGKPCIYLAWLMCFLAAILHFLGSGLLMGASQLDWAENSVVYSSIIY